MRHLKWQGLGYSSTFRYYLILAPPQVIRRLHLWETVVLSLIGWHCVRKANHLLISLQGKGQLIQVFNHAECEV